MGIYKQTSWGDEDLETCCVLLTAHAMQPLAPSHKSVILCELGTHAASPNLAFPTITVGCKQLKSRQMLES